MKRISALVLALALFFIPHFSFAAEIPYSFSAKPFLLFYTSSGYLHDDANRTDYGLSINVSYPVTPNVHAVGMAAFGFKSEFQFFGGGGRYDFVPATVTQVAAGESTTISSYRKWRPYVEVFLGLNTAQSVVHVGRINAQVIERTFGILTNGGCGYAMNSEIEINGNAMFMYGIASDLTVVSYGIMLGVKYHLF